MRYSSLGGKKLRNFRQITKTAGSGPANDRKQSSVFVGPGVVAKPTVSHRN